METVPCPLCGSERHALELQAPDLKDPAGSYSIVRCERCSFCFTNPRPSFAEISRHYAKDYYSYRRRVDDTPGTTTDREGPRLLDIGCGAGDALIRLQGEGFVGYGVELDPAVVEKGRARGLDVRLASPDRLDFEDEFFDRVRMNHVLEHLHDARAILAEVRRCLRRDGTFEVAVPNYASYEASLFGRWWRALDTPRHLSHFTPSSLERLLRMEGFDVLSCETLDTAVLSPGYLKGCATSCLAAARRESRLSGFRLMGSALRTAWRILRYSRHQVGTDDGNVIHLLARPSRVTAATEAASA